LRPISPNAVSAAAWTREYWKTTHMYLGPLDIAQWHYYVGLNFTSNAATPRSWTIRWGPDCWGSSLFPYFTGWDGGPGWCGVADQGTNVAQPGSHFYIAPVTTPVYKVWHWMRFNAYSNGSSSTVWGR
jgi:hypothetical protein